LASLAPTESYKIGAGASRRNAQNPPGIVDGAFDRYGAQETTRCLVPQEAVNFFCIGLPWQTQLTAWCVLIFGQPIESTLVNLRVSEGLAKAGSVACLPLWSKIIVFIT
jgi:hypothetical protein